MLHLHQSNRLEKLAAQFAALQTVDPLPPFTPEWVVVQNSGMGRWLSLQLAQHTGIAANLRYLFPAELTWELLRAVLGADTVPEQDPCAPPVLRWRLLAVLAEKGAWPELAHYLDTGELAAWQLAGQLAKVFDQYLFFRPQWIQAWEADGANTQDWQARLWRQVAGEQHLPHWVRLQERFSHAIAMAAPQVLPQRVSFFSVPALSSGYVQLLTEVAQHIDVHVFLMNPCQVYWGDIEPEKRKQKQPIAVQAYIEVGNPLLASWGRQGRDFLDLLVEADATDLFVDSHPPTLLGSIQADILHLRAPQPGSYQEGAFPSLSFHACHSPLREVEVLYDQLLELFAQHPDLTPADVVVMTPDIATYAPYFEAVFGSAPYPLPYSIADHHSSAMHTLVSLCRQLLALPQGRFDAASVLALLEFAEVRQHLGLDEAGVQQCRTWVREAAIRWGVDAASRAQAGGVATFEHTWRYGLDRLLLGYAMPSDKLFADVLPWDGIEGSQAEVLGRFCQWLDALFGMAAWVQQSQPLAVWVQRVRGLLQQVVGADAPLQPVWMALEALQQQTVQAGFAQAIGWQVFQAALLEQLDKPNQAAGFLGRGITCCALMPMRTVPFRFVALVGMNDGVFPRRDPQPSFDRMARHWQRGDRRKRDEDRYLFLESLLSARDWLYISYVGQSQRDNSTLPPAVLVDELLDYAERCRPGARTALVFRHPLQAFSRRYLRGEPGIFTYVPHATIAATATKRPSVPFWLPDTVLPPADASLRQVSLPDLIRFYQNPARAFLRIRLGLRLAEVDEGIPVREPFTLEDYQDREVRAVILHCLQQGGAAADALPLLRARGLLPHGKPGELIWQREAKVVQDFLPQLAGLPPLERRRLHLVLGDFELSGVVDRVDASGTRHVYELGKLNYWGWLDIWLAHLLLNTQQASTTQVYSPEGHAILTVVADAPAQLQQLLDWYWQGLHAPLPFFPKSAFELSKYAEPDVSKVMSTWEGSGTYPGESAKPEYRLLYRGLNPLEQDAETFVAITQAVFGRMRAALRPS